MGSLENLLKERRGMRLHDLSSGMEITKENTADPTERPRLLSKAKGIKDPPRQSLKRPSLHKSKSVKKCPLVAFKNP